ncbi:MAG TPA: SPFH domain-containing protein [Bryobacteraceae bacterium]|nr:SPFH domain-containing protein [Bryobacteraceae bacterium]
MLLIKYMLLASGIGLLAGAIGLVLWDVYRANARRTAEGASGPVTLDAVRWRTALRFALVGCSPLLLSASIAMVPSGMAGVLVSQISGVAPDTLYPGVHLVVPFVQSIALYDMRDQVFTTAANDNPKSDPKSDSKNKSEVLKIQTKEGLPLGVAVSVRYRLDPKRLAYIHSNMSQPVDQELVPAVVSSVFRQIVPGYLVRDVFAGMREEVRQRAADAITRKLATDGVLVKEIMLRDIQLPPEYAKGLESLLLKEQENDRLSVELEIKQKEVHSAELEAEADKARRVTGAEAEAAVVVLQAKAQADAMQHTLPLKQKQIEQSRLEAQARKETTVMNAEAMAQSKVIDSKAELEKRKLMSEADADHIRVVAAADAERMKSEGQVLTQNPLLIQKIIAERLSDKVQIMMVPNDGKFFFANDVLRGAMSGAAGAVAGRPASPDGQ